MPEFVLMKKIMNFLIFYSFNGMESALQKEHVLCGNKQNIIYEVLLSILRMCPSDAMKTSKSNNTKEQQKRRTIVKVIHSK